MKKVLLFIPLCILMLTMCIFAEEKLSPALDVIASNNEMIKAGIVYDGEICFDVNDFDKNLGANVKCITIKALPSEEDGKLMMGNLYVVENQVIYREDFASLKFIPRSGDEGSYSFTFSPDQGGYEISCSLKVLKGVNFSPVCTNGVAVSTWTQTDIATFGTLNGFDPDGDELKFEICELPERGLVEILNVSTGDYKYTPYEGAYGSDSFTYRVRDCYGNYSEEIKVNVKIKKLKTAYVFNDMENHESALNAAITLTNDNLMSVVKNADGTFSFNPEESITREEFIVLLMDTMGAKEIPPINKTRFADDKDIKPEYKGYIESAFALGIIEGERKADGVYINPKGTISTAEAAVIINRILGATKKTSITVFNDMSEAPEWAIDALSALVELGIIPKDNGNANPNLPLSRAQTARILMSLLEYRGKINK